MPIDYTKLVNLEDAKVGMNTEHAMIASNYSSASTYAVGAYAYYAGTLYKCTTAITTAEAWNSAHWAEAKLGNELASQSEKIDDVKTVLNDTFESSVGNEPIFLSKGWINTTLATIDITAVNDSDDYYYAVVSCSSGDVFTLNGTGAAAARLWAFITSGGLPIEVAASGVTAENLIKTAPSNSAYLVINVRTTSTNKSCFRNQSVNYRLNNIENKALEKTDDLQTAVNEITGNEIINFSSGWINTVNAVIDITAINASDSYMYAVLPCQDGDVFTINGNGGGSARLWAFITEDGLPISIATENETADNLVKVAPSNAAYFILNLKTSSSNIVCFKGYSVDARLGDITADRIMAKDYVAPRASEVAEDMGTADFAFGYFSDSHGQHEPIDYWNRTAHFLNIADRLLDFDAILNGGDIIYSSDVATRQQALVAVVKQNAEIENQAKQIISIGNHDQNGHTLHDRQQLSWTVTHEMFFNSCYRSLDRDPDVVWGSKEDLYFFKDFPLKKIRVIVLNTQDCGESIVTDDGVDYLKYDSLTVCGIRQAQLSWLANTALDFTDKDTPTDWHTIILSHIGLRTGIDANSPVVQNVDAVDDVIKAFVNGSSVTAQYTDTENADGLFTVDVTADFTSQGAMPLIGVFSGHNHCDRIYTQNYPQITILCAQVSGGPDHVNRELGTENEMAFDVVSVNKENRTVKLFRFGAGSDRDYTY